MGKECKEASDFVIGAGNAVNPLHRSETFVIDETKAEVQSDVQRVAYFVNFSKAFKRKEIEVK